ncbi:hypothetical protein OBV_20010 [Oscillibacter valericigenes Sjm18-20]|nr:hypothetical protein OBV_20010 [Oscillibacter valericigenes Sjm18-20]
MYKVKIGGSDVKEKWKTTWSRAAPVLREAVRTLGLYLDDLLLIGAGACFVLGAQEAFGKAAALAASGVWLSLYAVVIAKARRGGRR